MGWFALVPLVLAQAGPQAPASHDGLTLGMKFGIAVGIVVGSFILGSVVAKALRMPDYGFRLGVVFCSILAGVAVCVLGWPPKLGIDLSGGVQLVYEVDSEQQSTGSLQDAVSRLNRNLSSGGAQKVTARVREHNQIVVNVPKGDSPDEIAARVKKAAPLDITLGDPDQQTENGQTVLVYRLESRREAVNMQDLVAAVSRRINPGGVKEVTVRQYGKEQIEVIIPEVEEREVEQIKKIISTSGLLEFRIVADEQIPDHRRAISLARETPAREVYDAGRLVARWVKAGPDPKEQVGAVTRPTPRGTEVLVLMDPFNVKGDYLVRSAAGIDQHGGPDVEFSLSAQGAQLFGQLTGNNLPDQANGGARRLGIILDGELLSAPSIQSTITDRGQITGNFTAEQVNFLVGVLNAGRLPAALRPEPISEARISPQLGSDTIAMGTNSMLISTLAILVFMGVYYRFSGMIANLAVVVNIVITVALMILIKAAFTLAGLAGLVLTVGMAVDANVLIYERMREELARGTSLRMAIRNGFSRAMSTIVDSNLTTLITAVVLFIIGTDQIKGFAVTLILGLLVSMYTAIFVSRIIFDIVEKKRWLTQLKMMQAIGHTDIDFIRLRTPAVVVSLVIIAIGMVGVVLRGTDIFDIDFTGGSSVTMQLDKEYDIAKVRELVSDLPDAAVYAVGTDNKQFMINTSVGNIKEVQKKLQKDFGSDLRTYSMTYGDLAMIEAKPVKTPAKEKKPEAEKTPEAEKKPAAEKVPEPATKSETPPAAPETSKEKPEEAKKPDSNQGANHSLRSDRLLAAVGPLDVNLAAVLLAQDEPTAKPADKAEEAKPAKEEDKPEAKKEETKTDDAKKDEAKKDEAKPDEAKKPDSTSKPEPAKSETPAATETPKPEPPTAPAAPPRNEQPITSPVDNSYGGGTRVELHFPEPIKQATLEEIVKEEIEAAGLKGVRFDLETPQKEAIGSAPQHEWMLSITLDKDQTQQLLDRITARLKQSPVFPSSSEIGGKVANDMQQMAAIAMIASWLAIIVYVWVRFQSLVFGVAAVVALIHDVLVTVGFLAVSYYVAPYLGWALVDPFKISLSVVAALLTIIGFSINDTIVIFDRIREVKGKSPDLTPEMINLSVNQTLSRTMLTSGTVLIASVILYMIGGPGIHAFAFSMVIGVIAGTYSSVYIAAPIVLWMKKPQGQPNVARTPATSGTTR